LTVDERPVVAGSLYQWYSPHTHRSHEFVSLTADAVSGEYEGQPVWNVQQPGITWRELNDAPRPSSSPTVRLAQMRQIVSQYSCQKTDRAGLTNPLRLLRQPVYRYQCPAHDVVDGALFTFVQGTDPEVWILLETRTIDGELAWRLAATRMNSIQFVLTSPSEEIWRGDVLTWTDVKSRKGAYTTYRVSETE